MGIPKLNTQGNISKRDLILSAFTGFYFNLILFLHETFLNFFFYRFGLGFKNQYPGMTIVLLYLISPLAAGFLTYKLNKTRQFSFDKTLINGLTAALSYVFILLIILFFFEGKTMSVAALFGILFFSMLFSFIIAALNTTLLSRILTIRT